MAISILPSPLRSRQCYAVFFEESQNLIFLTQFLLLFVGQTLWLKIYAVLSKLRIALQNKINSRTIILKHIYLRTGNINVMK